MGFSGGGAEMVEMSIRTRDPKKSTRVPSRRLGAGSKGGGETRAALTSRAILPCRDRGGWATACSRRTPWGCSCHGPGRPPPAGRPYRSCARRCGCRKPSLSSLQVKTPSYRFREEVRSRSEALAANGHEFRRVSNGRGRARPLRSVREKRGRKCRFPPLLTPSFQFGMIFLD